VAHAITRAPVVVFSDNTLRDAADQMVTEGVGRLPVVERDFPHRLVGIISRSDLLSAHGPRLNAASTVQRVRRRTHSKQEQLDGGSRKENL
jgi:predicted transcriptional regulator